MSEPSHTTPTDRGVLADLGLGAAEESVYLSLLDLGTGTTDELSEHGTAAELTEAERDEALLSLVRRLLVMPVDGQTYATVDPEVALTDRLSDAERQARHVRELVETLAARHRRKHRAGLTPEALVEVVADIGAAKQYVVRTCRDARSEIMAMERPPYLEPQTAPNPLEMEALQHGITHRVLYEQSAIDMPGRAHEIMQGVAFGEQARVVPSLPMRMIVVDRRIAFLPARRGALIVDPLLVVHPGALLDAALAAFEHIWDKAIPLDAAGRASPVGLSEDDRMLLDLLAAGLTDDAIARQVGVSPRTVQRRVSDLTGRLGARTRFQAGLQASRLSWL